MVYLGFEKYQGDTCTSSRARPDSVPKKIVFPSKLFNFVLDCFYKFATQAGRDITSPHCIWSEVKNYVITGAKPWHVSSCIYIFYVTQYTKLLSVLWYRSCFQIGPFLDWPPLFDISSPPQTTFILSKLFSYFKKLTKEHCHYSMYNSLFSFFEDMKIRPEMFQKNSAK